jgi:hypothetical protein
MGEVYRATDTKLGRDVAIGEGGRLIPGRRPKENGKPDVSMCVYASNPKSCSR